MLDFAAGICYNCGESGHIQRNCPEADADSKKCYRYVRLFCMLGDFYVLLWSACLFYPLDEVRGI